MSEVVICLLIIYIYIDTCFIIKVIDGVNDGKCMGPIPVQSHGPWLVLGLVPSLQACRREWLGSTPRSGAGAFEGPEGVGTGDRPVQFRDSRCGGTGGLDLIPSLSTSGPGIVLRDGINDPVHATSPKRPCAGGTVRQYCGSKTRSPTPC